MLASAIPTGTTRGPITYSLPPITYHLLMRHFAPLNANAHHDVSHPGDRRQCE